MKLPHSAFVALLCTSGAAHAYDIPAYCKTVAEAVGGSYVIEEECRKQEVLARANLVKTTPPSRIDKYCEEVGSAVGGSYVIKEECAKQELKARARLQ